MRKRGFSQVSRNLRAEDARDTQKAFSFYYLIRHVARSFLFTPLSKSASLNCRGNFKGACGTFRLPLTLWHKNVQK